MKCSHPERGATLIEYLIGASIIFLMLVVGAAVLAKTTSTAAAYLEVSELEQGRADLADALRSDFGGAGRNLTRAEPPGTGTESWAVTSDSVYSASASTVTRTVSNASTPWISATRGLGSGLGHIDFTPNAATCFAGLFGSDNASRQISLSNDQIYIYESNQLAATSAAIPGYTLIPAHQPGDSYRISIEDTPAGRAVCYYRTRANVQSLLYTSTRALPAFPITPKVAIGGTGQFNNLELTGAPIVPLVDGAIQTALLPLDRDQRLTSTVTITGGTTVTILPGDPDTDVLYNKGLVLGTGAGTFVPMAPPKRGSFNTGDYAMVIDYQSNRSGLYRVTVLDAASSVLTLTFVWQPQQAAWGRLRSDPTDPLPAWPDGCVLVKLSPPVTYTVSADNRLVRMSGDRPATAAFGVHSFSVTEQATAVSKSFAVAATLATEGFETDQSAGGEPRDTVEYKSAPPALNLFNNQLNSTR